MKGRVEYSASSIIKIMGEEFRVKKDVAHMKLTYKKRMHGGPLTILNYNLQAESNS